MARRKPLAQGMNLGSRIMMDAASVQHALDISKSTLGRLIRRELITLTPFPSPCNPFGTKNRYWERATLERWVAEQLAAEQAAE